MHHILGQDRAIATLRAALRSGRMAHAWIFAGPRGVGKFTTAMALARIILDPAADAEGNVDPASGVARLIDAGAHPDLHVIRKELAAWSDDPAIRERKLLTIPTAVIRQHLVGGDVGGRRVDAPAWRTPAMGHAKVFIIDEAELLDATTQNILLKTLEEPPPRTYIILVTSSPERLLPTVRSRCQHARFGPLGERAMSEWFAQRDLGGPPDERAWISSFCRGSPGLALIAAGHGFFKWRQALDPLLQSLDAGRFPAESGQVMGDLVEGFAKSWVAAHENASKDAANKDGARYLLSIVAEHADRRLADAAGRGDDPRPWEYAIGLLSDAEQQMNSNVNLKLLLENLAVQWAAPTDR
jgi:DNA polymerase-3 subunit delta'